MRRFCLFALCVGGLLATAAPSRAQSVPPGVGLRVRVTAPALLARPLVGRTAAAPVDTLVIAQGDGDGARLLLPIRAVASVEISLGRQRLRWAVRGGAAGLLVGAVIGARAGRDQDPSGMSSLLGFVGGSALGLVTGTAAGALAAPERWERWHER